MYSQGYQQNRFQNQLHNQNIGMAASQYRSQEAKYQPVGYVQSQYNNSAQQGLNQSFAGSAAQQSFAGNQQYSQYQNPQSYHTANYRGNQQGHDNSLRADSVQPAQSQFGMAQNQSQAGFANQYSSSLGSAFSASQQPYSQQQYSQQQYSQQQNPQSYHLANYHGNQQGHDTQLRADSVQPAQHQFGLAQNQSQAGFANQYSSAVSPAFGASQQQFSQQQNPQQYHTANYRGNQQGHDNYLRSDAQQPAQSQFGMNAASSFANQQRYSF